MPDQGAARAHARSAALRYSIFSLLAIVATMAALFPLYWAFSQSLRNPLETFTVVGFAEVLITA